MENKKVIFYDDVNCTSLFKRELDGGEHILYKVEVCNCKFTKTYRYSNLGLAIKRYTFEEYNSRCGLGLFIEVYKDFNLICTQEEVLTDAEFSYIAENALNNRSYNYEKYDV